MEPIMATAHNEARASSLRPCAILAAVKNAAARCTMANRPGAESPPMAIKAAKGVSATTGKNVRTSSDTGGMIGRNRLPKLKTVQSKTRFAPIGARTVIFRVASGSRRAGAAQYGIPGLGCRETSGSRRKSKPERGWMEVVWDRSVEQCG